LYLACFLLAMVKTVLSSWTVAIALGDDSAGLVQLSSGVHHSQGQRILAAVATEGSTICVEAAAGDVAPVAGSYIAKMSQQAVEVAAGSVAPQAGSFCVPKQDVLLMQRTLGLNTARDFEAALSKKKDESKTTTTTTTNFENANFAENLGKKVMVQECPAEKVALLQAVDATVARKGGDSALGADERRVCECRSFLKRSAAKIGPLSLEDIQKLLALKAAPPTQLLQRNFDAALVTKNPTTAAPTTAAPTTAAPTTAAPTTAAPTNATPTTAAPTTTAMTAEQINERMMIGCTAASQFPVKDLGAYGMVDQVQLPSWAVVAKLLNDPVVASMFIEVANITEGWQHCDQSWVVHGACGKFLPVPTTTTTTTTALADCPLARPQYQPASDYYCNLGMGDDCVTCAKKVSSTHKPSEPSRSVDDMQRENAANMRNVMNDNGLGDHAHLVNAAMNRIR